MKKWLLCLSVLVGSCNTFGAANALVSPVGMGGLVGFTAPALGVTEPALFLVEFVTNPAIILTIPLAAFICVSSVIVRSNYYKRACNIVRYQEDIAEYRGIVRIRSKVDNYAAAKDHHLLDTQWGGLVRQIDKFVENAVDGDLITISLSIILKDDTSYSFKNIRHKLSAAKQFDLRDKIFNECAYKLKVDAIMRAQTKLGVAASINSLLTFVTPINAPFALVSWLCFFF